MTIGRRGFFAAVVAALGLNRLRLPAKPVLQACWDGGREYADVAIAPKDAINDQGELALRGRSLK